MTLVPPAHPRKNRLSPIFPFWDGGSLSRLAHNIGSFVPPADGPPNHGSALGREARYASPKGTSVEAQPRAKPGAFPSAEASRPFVWALALSLATAAFGCSSGEASGTTGAPSGGPGTLPNGAPGAAGAQGPNGAQSATPTANPSALPTATVDPNGVIMAIPYPAEKIAKAVNPKNEPAYSGPTGTLRGVIRITGDPAPELSVALPQKPCRAEAAATHGKLFRTGQGGTLADVLVAVTGYQGFVPAKGPAQKLTISRCAFSQRTVVATYGQRIEIANLDKIDSYMPYLDGGNTGAILVAIPGGDAVKLYPQEPAHYMIRDQLPNPHLTADVYVLAYATTDVTGLDGHYEIAGIPVGQVQVNAMLPATNKTAEQRIEIKPGDNTLDLTLTFDAKKDKPAPDAKPQ